jgi:hypothetical protein
MPPMSSLRKQRQKDHKFGATLNYIERSCLKKKKRQEEEEETINCIHPAKTSFKTKDVIKPFF